MSWNVRVAVLCSCRYTRGFVMAGSFGPPEDYYRDILFISCLQGHTDITWVALQCSASAACLLLCEHLYRNAPVLTYAVPCLHLPPARTSLAHHGVHVACMKEACD